MWLPSWPKTKLYIPYVFHTLPDGLGDNEIVRLFLSPERQEISDRVMLNCTFTVSWLVADTRLKKCCYDDLSVRNMNFNPFLYHNPCPTVTGAYNPNPALLRWCAV